MQSSSQGRYGYAGYQGFPYVNPMVIDVPTIDAETASRWANLPRRPMQAGPSVTPGTSGAANRPQAAQKPEGSSDTVPLKRDVEDNPVVYIDMPVAGSEVSRSIVTPEDEEPEFVKDTIMYDPFENRRINIRKEDARSIASSESESNHSGGYTPHLNSRPEQNRPNTLNIGASGSSLQSPPSAYRQPGLPNFMSKESQVYGADGSDGFPISPIPISEFPEPPPAYTEMPTTQASIPREQQAVQQAVEETTPPRTQVIVPSIPKPATPEVCNVAMPEGDNVDRKFLVCHYCGSRVNSLVVREVGPITHLIACLVLALFFPLVILVYCLDYFKYRNYYCPNCSKLIGYQSPIGGLTVTYNIT